MSYARGDDFDGLVRRFYRELCVEVAMRGGLLPAAVGYIDRSTVPGDSWSTALSNALETCRVFVPLISPSYFSSHYCGREWYVFWERMRDYDKEHSEWPALLIPILWIPTTEPWPEAAQEIQNTNNDLGTDYRSYGLRYLMQTNVGDVSYKEALVRISLMLIEAGKKHRMPPGRTPPLFSTVPNMFQVTPSHALPQARPDRKFTETYLQRIRTSHERLRFGDPTSHYARPSGPAQYGRMRLRDVFITPSVIRQPPESSENPALQHEPAVRAVGRDEHRHVVLVGGPGTGKTTLIDYLVNEAASEHVDQAEKKRPLPVHVRLGDVESSGDGELMDLFTGVHEVRRHPSTKEPDQAMAEFLLSRIQRGEVTLFLDGLDEVRPELLRPVAGTIAYLADSFPQCRVIVTCREYDYLALGPSERLPFSVLALLPFDTPEILAYVDRWYEALARLEPLRNSDDMKRELMDSLRDNDDLRELASTALLLTLIAIMSIVDGALPSRRSTLYYRAVRYLLEETPQWRGQGSASSISVDEILPIAAKVANRLHFRDEEPDSTSGFSMRELETIIAEHLGLDQQMSPREYRDIHRKVNTYLIKVTQTNGLIIDQGNGVLTFAHRALREFLAGMHFLNGADYEASLLCPGRSHWRQPLLLMAGHGAREGQSLFYLAKYMTDVASLKSIYVNILPQRLIVAEMLAEIGKQALVSGGYGRVLSEDIEGPPETGLWNGIITELHRAADGDELSGKELVRLLFALGRLGDPRLVDRAGAVRPLEPRRMAYLSSGVFKIGTNDDEIVARSMLRPSPARDVTLAEYYMDKYPVTNVQYRAFIDSGGYSDLSYWDTEEARLWLTGDSDFCQVLYDQSMSSFERDFQPELKDTRHSEPELLANLRLMAASRTEPLFWRNSRFNGPNQPVVGVNYWEARAYCSWLTRRRQKDTLEEILVRLPTEYEWERATRPDNEARRFPWGNVEPDGAKAHYRSDGMNIQRATPVGSFPTGTWPGGPLDLCGNVWEWTASRALSPDAEDDRHRDNANGTVDRVIRGGSWYCLIPAALHSSFRGVDRPQNVYVDLGFRVVAQLVEESKQCR